MSRPWMPLYWGDLLRDTLDMNATVFGAYMLLIGEYWNKGKLPDNEGDICRVARLTSQQWRWHRDKLKSMFDAHWRHKRIDAEIEKCETIRTKKRIAGMRGGLASRGKTNRGRNVTQAFAKHQGEQSQSQRLILSYFGESQQEGKEGAGEEGSKISTELMERVERWKR